MRDRILGPVATALLVVLFGLSSALADSPKSPRPDEKSAEKPVDSSFLRQYAATYRFRLGHPTAVKVTPEGDAVLFLRSGPRSFVRDLWLFDVKTGHERRLLSAESILAGSEEQLSAEERAHRERMRLAARGVATYELSDDGRRLLVPLGGRLFVVERESGKTRALESRAGAPLDARFSPDGRRVACVRGGDLYIFDLTTGRERRLTETASDTLTNGLADFVAQEEMGRYHGYEWSPDSRYLVYQETDTAKVERLYIGDPLHPENAPHPWAYPRAGRDNARVRLGVVPVSGGPTVWLRWDRARYPYLATMRWSDNAPLTIVVQNRTQTEEVVLSADPRSGATHSLLIERDAAWLNIDQTVPRWLPDGSGFLWSTERGGAWELELRSADGARVRTVIPQKIGYRALRYVDGAAGVVWALGGETPLRIDLYRVPLDPDAGVPERVTEALGEYDVAFPHGHSGVYALFEDRADAVHRVTVHDAEGRSLGTLRSVAETPPFEANIERVEVHAGSSPSDPTFQSAVIRPRDFTPDRKYPVIVYVYGGPGYRVVRAIAGRYRLHQWIADQGFIVVLIDGRGTPNRGRAWERALKGDMAAVPMADQVAGLQALGARFSELDLDRVGIFGWSYGGYMAAMAVMARPDVYRAGVAVAPVVDWRDYDTHYTERYLGLPRENPDGYERSSLLTAAKHLSRPLLVMHGTADDNVYFFHSLKLMGGLFRAGKRADFMPLVGFTHIVPDPEMTVRIYTTVVDYLRAGLRRSAIGRGPRGGGALE